jgi:hypothetical protein
MKGLEKRGRHTTRPPEQFAIENVTPVERCAGAFKRPCVQLTSAVLCDDCWTVVQSTPVHLWKSMTLAAVDD